MSRAVLILCNVFFLGITSALAFAGVVPGALLHLDASDNPGHPDAWTNLGAAGGELPAGNKTPILETGTIEIPGLGFTLKNTKFYTCKQSGQTFGGPEGTNPELPLASWTFEALMKRNGDVLFKEHWVFGFAVEEFGPIGAFLGAGRQKGGELFTTRPVAHKAHGIDLERDEWTWIAFGSDRDRSVFYQDGNVVDRDRAYVFNRVLPVKFICIFCGHHGERDRSFNGSFAVVRIYDKVLSKTEIMKNITAAAALAVDPASKLAATWGMVKTRY